MTRDSQQPGPTPHGHTSLLDSVYEVALNPARYDELVAQWHRELQATQTQTHPPQAGDPPLAEHFSRATTILERVHPEDWQLTATSAAPATQRPGAVSMPELTLAQGGRVLATNYGAAALLNARVGCTIEELDLPASAARAVLSVIARLALERSINAIPHGGAEPRVLRITRSSDDRPLVVVLSPGLADDAPVYQLRCAEIVWPETFGPLLARAFELTTAECDIVQALVAGHNTAAIAELRGTSKETVRTQIRELLAKTGTHSQLELIRMTIGFSMMSQQAEARTCSAPPAQQPMTPGGRQTANDEATTRARSHLVQLRSGKQLEVIEYGPATGAPVLVFHDEVIGDAFVLPIIRQLDATGVTPPRRFIVPARAGFGATSPMNDLPDSDRQAQTDEMLAALAALIKDAQATPLLAQGNGIYFACEFTRRYHSLCGPMTVLAGSLPAPLHGAGGKTADPLPAASRYASFMAGMSRRAPSMLRFAVQAGFAMYARVGSRRFLETVYGDVAVDQQIIQSDEVLQDLEHGGRLTLAQGYRGFLLDEQTLSQDWVDDLLASPVPLRLIVGDQDQPRRRARARNLAALSDRVVLINLRNAGFFAAFSATSAVAEVLLTP